MHRDPIEMAILSNMKLALISRNKETNERIRGLVESLDGQASLHTVAGGLEQAASVAAKERPDVMLLEGVRHDEHELLLIEPLTLSHPRMAVVLLSPNHSPEYLRMAMRIGLREILPTPVAKEGLLETLGRIHQRLTAGAPRSSGRILCFVGCKGGSGVTFLATNLGYALASQGRKKVALIDLNTQFGDAAIHITDRKPVATLADVCREVHRLDGAFLTSSMLQVLPNFHVLAAPEEPEQAMHLRADQIDAVLCTAAAHYDLVVVDAGRSLNELTVRAMDHAETVFAVLQQSLPFMRDAQRLLRALNALGYGKDKVKLIINRFDRKGLVGPDEVAGSLKHEVDRTIPNSYGAVADSINQGVPILKLDARDPVARSLEDMAGALAGVRSREHGGWLRNLWTAR